VRVFLHHGAIVKAKHVLAAKKRSNGIAAQQICQQQSLRAETIQVSLPALLSHPIFIAAARTNFYLRRALIFRINSISEVVIFNL
jgi:hypothetical protein